MSEARKPLAQAFVHQSLAAARNRVRSQKAALEGDSDAALVLSALAEAQEVHARKALAFLRGRIGPTGANLAEALQELRELAVAALDLIAGAEAAGDPSAAALLTQMAKAVASHAALPGFSGAGAKAGGRSWVCAVCGHAHQGQPPERCPVCGAPREEFQAAGEGGGGYHVCSVCGYVHAGPAPGRCPVCQAVPEKFREAA